MEMMASRSIIMTSSLFFLGVLSFLVVNVMATHKDVGIVIETYYHLRANHSLILGDNTNGENKSDYTRMINSTITTRVGSKCAKSNIEISQSPTTKLPSGIPSYLVEITNTCYNGCFNIHINCGTFSSARLINPKIFRRLAYNDCLVNDGKALASGATISFEYSNTFPYPLSVTSVTCN